MGSHRVGPRLLEPHHHRLRLTATADAYVAAAPAAVAAACAAALDAANGCYAPYSESYAGIALCDADGRVYPGGSIESCAYNPTMAPLQVSNREPLSTLCEVERQTVWLHSVP
jgi:cytidine deaminase